MAKVRVLVVDDSLTVRRQLCAALAQDKDIEIAGEAVDGKQAIQLCRELRPDVITLDMMLPVMSGLATTEYVMAHFPTPILIVSSSNNRGAAFKMFDALTAGAVDVLEKPTGDEAEGEWERKFVSTVKLVSRIRVITHPRGRLGGLARVPSERTQLPEAALSRAYRIVAIGVSTGGPSAIGLVLRTLQLQLPIPVLVVLHLGEQFGGSFAGWLETQVPHRVSYARDGEPAYSIGGRVVLAPPGRHLLVRGGRLRLTSDPERHSCRPSVDVLFESLASEYGEATLACLLTGMGRDGAGGLLEIRKAGGCTIAQDEATSIVYGMPREAVLLGAAERVLPLGEIGPAIAELLARTHGSGR
jgi:two-component system, chemotaxis family, protein-glutamate methylesterase/glutaminase